MSERRAYIEEQRSRHGRKAVAVLPIHYPKELLTAMDLLSVELWGPPGQPAGHHVGRIQAYVCPMVRNALAFLAEGRAEVVDAVLFPHTCDSIQGLATLAPDFGGWGKKVFRFLHPKGSMRTSSRVFLDNELRELARELEVFTGRSLDPARLSSAIALHRRIDAARAELLARRRHLPMSDRELYTLLRRGEYLWPEEHLGELEAARARLAPEPIERRAPVLVTGYVPEPMEIFDALNGAGAVVVADDYAAVGRRIVTAPVDLEGDPFAVLGRLYEAAPPCSTRAQDQERRIEHLLRLYRERGARGVLIHEVKFCEPELFDVGPIRKAFSALGAPTLYVESELERELSQQTVARIEAFGETLSAGRRAA